MHFKYIFVVLVYKNTDVLDSFFKSISNIEGYKCVLVNAFYDQITEQACKEKALTYHADFISIPNVGYGEGNNRGIEYAVQKYSFDYLIISNSDIIVKDFSILNQIHEEKAIYASCTKLCNGHHQNPLLVRENRVYYYFLRKGYFADSYYLVRIGQMFARLERELFLFLSKILKRKKWRVFGAHGSFMVLTYRAIKDLYPLFEKRIFLYNEEQYLAYKCKEFKIPIYYLPELKVLHLEGASAGYDFRKQFPQYKESFMVLDTIISTGKWKTE